MSTDRPKTPSESIGSPDADWLERTEPSNPAHLIDPYIGSVIQERYKVLSRLGEGGMGVVYLAEHVIIEKRVAIKILSDDFARKSELVARFMQEAKAASKIGHENIVDITDFGETESGSVFFVMEHLEGHDLAHYIREEAPFDVDRARRIMLQVCRALAAAHQKGIIHRDLKPENIFLIEREGRKDFVKILDFGIAKMSNVEEAGARLTRTGMIFGTPEYMSPEQARGDRPDHRVDIYAAGCILYEMLTGAVPFSADTFMGVLTKHMFEQVPKPTEINPDIAPEIVAVVMRTLDKDREQRFQTMKQLGIALETAAGGDADNAWLGEASGTFQAREHSAVFYTSRQRSRGRTPVPETSDDDISQSLRPRGLGWRLPVGIGVVAILAIVLWALSHPSTAPTAVVESQAAPVAPVAIPEPVKEPVVAAPESHQITLRSEPSGADVWNGAERIGVTPMTMTWAHSDREIELVLKKKSFANQSLHVTPDKEREYFLELPAASVKRKDPKVAPVAKPAAPTHSPTGLKDPFAN